MRITLFLFTFFIGISSLWAQQFKWAKGGGSNQSFSTSFDRERTRYMCTDPNGNIYALSKVGNNAIYADTFYKSGAYGASDNFLITSYNCNGQMRWAKLIAASSGPCYPDGIIADSLGHVYVGGYMRTGTLHIGNDTTIGSFYMVSGLIQFDTSGGFNWIRYVGDNTPASMTGAIYLGCPLVLDASNNIHFLNFVKSGVHITPSVTSIKGTYDLVYNSSGTLLSQTRLDLDSQWFLYGAVIDPSTNKLYGYGQVNRYFLGGTTVDTFYAAAFDASRNRLWQYFCGIGGDDAVTGIVMDNSKHLYFSGAVQGSPTFSFNGDSVSGIGRLSIIMKTDTNGGVKWIQHYDCLGTSVNALLGVTLLPNNKVAAVGTYAGIVKNGFDSITTSSGDGQNAYVVIVNATGDLQKIQRVRGNGFYDDGAVIVSDRAGNIYIGGEVEDSIWGETPVIPAYHTAGGTSDFFILKYGMDCSCTSIPISSFVDTGSHTIGVAYTGTTVGIDSVVWRFGDGTSATGLTAMHTYTTADTFRVCATVYTSCGNDIHCTDVVILIPSLVSTSITTSSVKVYPNPANDELNILGIGMQTKYRLLSITGTVMHHGILPIGNSVIPMKDFAAGIYILELTDSVDQPLNVRVIKN